MAYTDFTYYTNTYLGDSIAESDFPRLAMRASQVLDRVTFGRAAVETDTDVIDQLKKAMCAVAEELQTQDRGGSVGIASESQGAYSVSYNGNAMQMKSPTERLEYVARMYLETTSLMFGGFNDGELGNDTE